MTLEDIGRRIAVISTRIAEEKAAEIHHQEARIAARQSESKYGLVREFLSRKLIALASGEEFDDITFANSVLAHTSGSLARDEFLDMVYGRGETVKDTPDEVPDLPDKTECFVTIHDHQFAFGIVQHVAKHAGVRYEDIESMTVDPVSDPSMTWAPRLMIRAKLKSETR